MKILFICSANKQHSKTAEDFFAEKFPEFKFLSAGTNSKICRKEGTNELTENLLKWADKIYVMEKRHLDQIKKHIYTITNLNEGSLLLKTKRLFTTNSSIFILRLSGCKYLNDLLFSYSYAYIY